MPQMAPISWITLYLFFSMLFVVTCILNFYTFKYSPQLSSSSKMNKNLSHWKW
uniref:ATP synthase complex subunit 8 n=1 Tax=Scolytinae sp. BMNH 1274287 TaxID=2558036 RepID=A0A140EGD9_9CUCU|nr:ATP synthase F0 subunit 8 [Scolytinae sp. BMNH 1274287]